MLKSINNIYNYYNGETYLKLVWPSMVLYSLRIGEWGKQTQRKSKGSSNKRKKRGKQKTYKSFKFKVTL